jgi:hypothetical protein
MRVLYDSWSLSERYAAAEPFPYIVLAGLFDDEVLDAVLQEFPSREAMTWREFDTPLEKKLGYYHETSRISKTVRDFLNDMNSFEMLLWLEAVTGIEGLIPDPYFGGGGLHQIEPGGFLKIHAFPDALELR